MLTLWELKSGLLGFTQLNNAHNGERLGQALFKIIKQVGIEKKVGYLVHDIVDGEDEVDGKDGGDGPGPGFEAAEGRNDILLEDKDNSLGMYTDLD